MAQFPCLPIWTDAWVADTKHLSLAEEGAYFRLAVEMWRTPGCRVPNDDAWLARHLHVTADELRNIIRPVIAEFCQSDGNFITQKRLKREFVDRFEFGGRMSALAKRRHRKTNGASNRRTAADALPPSLNLNTKDLSYFGESQCDIPSTTSTTKAPTTEHHPEPATQDHPQAKTTSPSPPITDDQPAHSKNTTVDNPDPSPPTRSPTPHPPPTNSEPRSSVSQQPPETLAEINQRMGWSQPHYPSNLTDDEKRNIAIDPKFWTPAQIHKQRNQSSGR
jgi:uncharacterized protein YdaU (DUF1376 family)